MTSLANSITDEEVIESLCAENKFLVADNELLKAECDAMAAESDWQTIDSAKKDGTKIFITWPGAECAPLVSWQVFEGGNEDGTGCVFMWALEDDSLNVGQEDDGWIGFDGDPEPTHWILPPPENSK